MEIKEIKALLRERGDRIKKLLEDKGVSQVMIANELGITPPTVNQVMYQGQVSRRVQDLICEKLGMTFDEVWG